MRGRWTALRRAGWFGDRRWRFGGGCQQGLGLSMEGALVVLMRRRVSVGGVSMVCFFSGVSIGRTFEEPRARESVF